MGCRQYSDIYYAECKCYGYTELYERFDCGGWALSETAFWRSVEDVYCS